MTVSNQKHILFHCIPLGWTHLKPAVPLVYQILQSRRNVIITVLVTGNIYPKLLAELDKLPAGFKEDTKARFHIIDIAGMVPNSPFLPLLEFETVLKAMYNGEPIKCLSSGKEYRGFPPVTVAVIDPFSGYAIEAIHEISQNQNKRIPILTWCTSNAGSTLQIFKSAPSGKLDTRLIRYGTAEEIEAILPELVEIPTGEVISIPGIPPMYDYETFPQEVPFSGNTFFELGRKYLTIGDGMFLASSTAYDGEAMDAVKEWFDSLGKVVYPVGPLSFPERSLASLSVDSDSDSHPVVKFLDRMQSRYGEKSVLYMSFGTIFWPSDPSKVWTVIEEILSSGTPLILAHPSPLCHPLPEDKLKMFTETYKEISFEIQWAPQEVILSHPATGWFISHGGWNSTQEAMTYRVPQIFWPQAADQPLNAATVTLVNKAGFELVEVRTGEYGTRVPYRYKMKDSSNGNTEGMEDLPTFTIEGVRKEIRKLIRMLRGEEGVVVRKNFERMSKGFLSGWDEGGEARESLERFLERYVD